MGGTPGNSVIRKPAQLSLFQFRYFQKTAVASEAGSGGKDLRGGKEKYGETRRTRAAALHPVHEGIVAEGGCRDSGRVSDAVEHPQKF
ncbi:hypothetical protein SDC9_180139 [bioreactor metagenome]|uniref:Uncharacterized protein n=1 Tax=bioreactor metagenome TaxID=1076179 RepID=A0A645H3T6_9ZZZZ